MSHGLWVADCPREGCRGAEHYGSHPVTGYVGGLSRSVFRCENCKLSTEAQWPSDADDIEMLLSARPVPETRNWLPGESVRDLLTENLANRVG